MTTEITITCTVSVDDDKCASVTELAEMIEGSDITMELDSGLDVVEVTVENATITEA